ncbi:MAG: peptide deformylase [Ignavibacteriales bacterium]|nr:peptide deformylase [Ignavibacteriales bacterium]
MRILPIYLYGSAVLRTRAQEVTRVTETLKKQISAMVDTMFTADGVGLAANQVGLLKRVIVINPCEEDDNGQERLEALVLLNPEVVEQKGKFKMKEGCLSLPDIREDVTRAECITIRFQDLELNSLTLEADGLTARVLLHEIDHLNGVMFVDHLSLARRALLRGKLRSISRGKCETEYPVVADKSAPRKKTAAQKKKGLR